jgi:hypothetical protein
MCDWRNIKSRLHFRWHFDQEMCKRYARERQMSDHDQASTEVCTHSPKGVAAHQPYHAEETYTGP